MATNEFGDTVVSGGAQKNEYGDTLTATDSGLALERALAEQYRLKGARGEVGNVEKYLGGAKASLDRWALGLKEMLPERVQDLGDWIDTHVGDKQPLTDAALQQGKAFVAQNPGLATTLGGLTTDIAVTAPAFTLGGAAAGAAGALPRVAAATSALPRAVRAAGTVAGTMGVGAGTGYVGNPEDRAAGALEGAEGTALGLGLGKAIQSAPAAIRRLGGPLVKPTPEAQALIDRGIQPTIGQASGRGWLNAAEQRLQDMPLVGGAISGARQRALGEFNAQAAATAARPVGASLEGMGDEALLGLRKQIGAVYDAALDPVPRLRIDPQAVISAATDAMNNPQRILSADSKKTLADYVSTHVLGRGDTMTGQVANRVQSDMGAAVRNLLASPDGEKRALGDALREVHEQLKDSILAALPEDARAAMKMANEAWRAFLPVDLAASSAGAQGAEVAGTATPRMLRRAIERLDKSQFNNASRAGALPGAPVRSAYDEVNQLTRAGEAVLPQTVPNSGTAARIALPASIGGGAAAFLHNPVGTAVGAGATWAAAHAVYSRLGQRLLTQGIAPQTAADIAQWARQYALPPEVVLRNLPAITSTLAAHPNEPQEQQP